MNSPRLPRNRYRPRRRRAPRRILRGEGKTGDDVPGGGPIRLVADASTYAAVGVEAERELRAAGLADPRDRLRDPHLAADARSILRLLADDDPRERPYIAVGSGTITDIVRFVCHRTGRDFVCLATAPSVDAYASVVAPIIIEGMKRTIPAAAPIAIFADTETLARPPADDSRGFRRHALQILGCRRLEARRPVWGESFDEAIALRSIDAARACVDPRLR